MDSSPSSPSSRRRSGNFGGRITPVTSHSRRSSGYSQHKRMSGQQDLASSLGPTGLDSLADELADAWNDDDDDDTVDESELDKSQLADEGNTLVETTRDSGIGGTGAGSDVAHERHRSRKDSHDMHTLGNEPMTDLPASLKACLADVEGLAKQGASGDGAARDESVLRIIEGLKDLGGQAGIENGTSRLITAHTSMSVNLAQQTRSLQTLTYALLSPLSPPPDEDQIEELLPLVADSIALIPHPMLDALHSLAQLSSGSKDLIDTLGSLSDSLHMSRQITATASRSLKSARELVAEIRRENTAADDGVRWVEDGKWQKKLEARECAQVCKDVVGGFEAVCNGWREKLEAGAQVSAA